MTTAQLKASARDAIRQLNPNIRLHFEFGHVSPVCKYADGSGTFRTATIVVTSPGFRPRTMIASVDMATRQLSVR